MSRNPQSISPNIFANTERQQQTRIAAPRIFIFGVGACELMSRVRSALSPWIDLRNQADVVRDQLEEHGWSVEARR